MSISRHSWQYFCSCIVLIGCARDPTSSLVSRLSDPDVTIRRGAARALAEQSNSDEPVIAALTKSTGDNDIEVRLLSIAALAKRGLSAKPAVPVLKTALADSEKRVRQEAALAILKIDQTDSSPRPVLIIAMREGDGRTLLAIGSTGSDAAWAVPTLIGLLAHASPQVRALAARTLGRIGPAARAAKAALEAARGDPNAAVQNASTEALARLQKPAGAAN